MAFSQPLSEFVGIGQVAVFCHLCKNDQKLKWKCLECGLKMCQRCRDKFHPEIPSTQKQKVINIKEIRNQQSDQEPKLFLTKIKCGVHSEQNCCLYCETCEKLVCQTCVTQSHDEHDFLCLSDQYNIKLEKIRDGQKNIEKEMQSLTVMEQKLKQIKLTEQSNYTKVKQEILAYDKTLVNQMKKSKLLNELKQKWEVFSNSVEHEEKKLMQVFQQNTKVIELTREIIKKNNAEEVFFVSDSLLQSMKASASTIKTSFHGIPKVNNEDITNIRLELGELVDLNPCNNELKVETKFETDLSHISSVVSTPTGSLWICDSLSNKLQKIKRHEGNFKVFVNLTITVNDIAVFNSGDLLFSSEGSSNLRLIHHSSTSANIKDSVYFVLPQQGHGVHVTSDNQVIVATAYESRQIIMTDQTGNKNIFKRRQSLFTNPYRLTSSSKSIAVVDLFTDDWRGRVVVLDQKGKVRNIYTGHSDVNNKDSPFKPTCIKTTPLENFVVTDYINHTLHILNSEGEIIAFYNTEKLGILLPLSLSFSILGNLYIGCGTYQDSEEKAKLFKVNNFPY